MKLRVSHRLRIAGLALGLVAGCFRQVPEPPDFRYVCASDDECVALLDDDGEPMLDGDGEPYRERCINGLCQFRCHGSLLEALAALEDQTLTVVDGCPSSGDYICFNGLCSNFCTVNKDPTTCPAPQTCLGFDSFELFGDTGGATESSSSSIGICGIRCDDDDAIDCPEGQVCASGLCLDLSGFGTTGGTTDAGTSGATSTTTTTTAGTDTDATDTDATTGGTGP